VGPLANQDIFADRAVKFFVTTRLLPIVLAVIATPVLYGLGAAAIEATGYRGDYSDGRLLLGICFFLAFSMASIAVRLFGRLESVVEPKLDDF
jgi:hypothetical protein